MLLSVRILKYSNFCQDLMRAGHICLLTEGDCKQGYIKAFNKNTWEIH